MKKVRRSRRGLGASDGEHAQQAAALYATAEESLQQAEALAEHGLCQRAFMTFTLGAEQLASAQAHENGHAKQARRGVAHLRQNVQGSIAARCIRGAR